MLAPRKIAHCLDQCRIATAAIPATPFTITPTVPNSGIWSQDLGVLDATGVAYVRVASAPVSGQYSLANGVYTFAAADTGKTVYISYKYGASSTTAKRQIMTNLPMNLAPRFRLDLFGGEDARMGFVERIEPGMIVERQQIVAEIVGSVTPYRETDGVESAIDLIVVHRMAARHPMQPRQRASEIRDAGECELMTGDRGHIALKWCD